MSDSFSGYLADQLINYLADNTQFDTPPETLWLTVWDDAETELSDDLQDARLGVDETGWTIDDPAGDEFDSRFENTDDISLGEATADLTNVERFVVYDSETEGNLLMSSPIESAPFDVAQGTELTFNAGDVSFDAIEYNEPTS